MSRAVKLLEIISGINTRSAGDTSSQYKTLNDAANIDQSFKSGSTGIWYLRPDLSQERMGSKWLIDKGLPLPDPKKLGKTHVLVGSVKESDLHKIFRMMQGDYWSPNGEANTMIARRKLAHTSMSIGDAIQKGGKAWLVDRYGFTAL
jgi:hypothetical protein